MNTADLPASTFRTAFGPGLLWAAAAIGVSHLVQSTRAGATAGFGLAGIIALALILKYPFFEFGPRYAAATGTSLIAGYARIGRWALWLFGGITLTTAIISQTAVVLFTAFLFQYALRVTVPIPVTAGALIGACVTLLWFGRYHGLDLTIKVILVILALSTLAAALVVVPRVDLGTALDLPIGPGGIVPFAFLLALVGWMPSPVDTAVWSSLWTLAKDRTTGHRTSVKHATTDFRIGYVGTGVLAFAFVTLGAGVMYGSGVEFSPQGTVFSTQLAELYAQTLGTWALPLVLVAMVTTMFSTTLTVIDGFPRAIEQTFAWLRPGHAARSDRETGGVYWFSVAALAVLTVIILSLFIGDLTTMVDFATIISFLTAPVLGYLNLRAVTGDEVPLAHQPGRRMVTLTWVGLALLGGTGVVYLLSWTI